MPRDTFRSDILNMIPSSVFEAFFPREFIKWRLILQKLDTFLDDGAAFLSDEYNFSGEAELPVFVIL